MRKKFSAFFIPAAVILLLSLSGPAFAKKNAGLVGTVDMNAIYAFHPTMQYYDKAAGFFIKPVAEGAAYQDLLKAMGLRAQEYQQNREARSAEISKLAAEIKKAGEDIKKAENGAAEKFSKLESDFNDRLSRISGAKIRQEMSRKHNEECMKIQSECDSAVGALRDKLASATGSLEKINDELLKTYYLTSSEGSDLLKKINDEIKEAVSYAASARGVNAVVNSARISLAGDGPDETKPEEASPADARAGTADALEKGPDYSKVLSVLRAGEAGGEDDNGKGQDDPLKRIYYERKLVSSLDFKGERLFSSSSIAANSDDLTLEVISHILKKHNIPKENADAVREIISGAAPELPSAGKGRDSEVSSESAIGSIDFRTVVAFHPMMFYYDPQAGLFLRPAENLVSAIDLEKIIEKRNGDFVRSRDAEMPEIRRIRAELAAAADELSKIGNRRDSEIERLNESSKEDIAAAGDEKDRQARIERQARRTAEIKKNYAADEKKLSARLDELSASLEKIQAPLLKHHYLTPSESAAMIRKIDREACEAVRAVAKSEGISTVVDAGSNSATPAPSAAAGTARNAAAMQRTADILESGPNYSNLCNLMMPAVPEAARGKNAPADNFKAIAGGIVAKRLKNNFDYFRNAPILEKTGGDDLRDSFIVSGGKDITAKTVSYLLEKNGIQSEIAAAIVKFLSK